jgi:hypothetical protein
MIEFHRFFEENAVEYKAVGAVLVKIKIIGIILSHLSHIGVRLWKLAPSVK